jgi:uncharacterized membrane protein
VDEALKYIISMGVVAPRIRPPRTAAPVRSPAVAVLPPARTTAAGADAAAQPRN